jgi:hypothetical protein|uniref:Uncharacterized protein n=1 Tax=virus sp. ctE0n6 TaxID=2827985 RepID=A0A8S5RFQ2_9VIRU|nr:MAG TPA: hypothetical protein [virus sp. ctE0n6]
MKGMWMVYTNEYGVTLITDDYEEAVLEYNKYKDMLLNDEIYADDEIILAKVDKRIFAFQKEFGNVIELNISE